MFNLTSRFGKFVFLILATVVCFVPLWLYLAANWAFAPEGFWQKLVLAGAGFYFLGAIQLFLFVAYVAVLVGILRK